MTDQHADQPESGTPPENSVEAHAPTMLIVDDNEVLRERLAKALVQRGYLVKTASNYEEAIAAAQEESPEMAVVDLRMPGRNGLDLLRDLREIDPATKVVMLTGFGSTANVVDAMKLGATNYITKPADADDVLAAFARGEAPPGTHAPDYQPLTLARAEWEHIQRVLADCGGNISEAARRLGIHRRSLQRKLQKLAPE